MHAFVRRTDGLFLSLDRVCIPCRPLQVAQLSRKDRAAGWVSNGQKWETGTETIFTDNIGLYSTTATYLASNEIEIGEKTQNKGCYAV